ncbi:MAG: hypothetical protein KF745_06695 [Phycisphaeraceae bacterium]|nr:hypothetical protein [Phycisphaeraceae bacterium]
MTKGTSRALVLAGLACAGAGCYSTAPMSVEVRNASSGRPIEGAQVWIEAINVTGPLSLRSALGIPPMPARGVAKTDSFGRATLTYETNDPMRVYVIMDQAPPVGVTLARHPALSGPTSWYCMFPESESNTGPPGFAAEVRFLPGEP